MLYEAPEQALGNTESRRDDKGVSMGLASRVTSMMFLFAVASACCADVPDPREFAGVAVTGKPVAVVKPRPRKVLAGGARKAAPRPVAADIVLPPGPLARPGGVPLIAAIPVMSVAPVVAGTSVAPVAVAPVTVAPMAVVPTAAPVPAPVTPAALPAPTSAARTALSASGSKLTGATLSAGLLGAFLAARTLAAESGSGGSAGAGGGGGGGGGNGTGTN